MKGSHKAVNTHRQRLLVAAHKSTNAPELKTSDQKAKNGKAKAQPKKKPKKKAKLKAKAKGKAKAKAKAKATGQRADTAYNVERKKFLSEQHPHSTLSVIAMQS